MPTSNPTPMGPSQQQPLPNAGTLPSSPVQQFGNNPTGLSKPTTGGAMSAGTFTRGSDTQVATARDMARAAGAKR